MLRALLATTVAALTFAAPSGAILNGTPDTAHPYVGILVTEIGGQPVPVCSGFLVSPTVFVTAAHCVDDLGGTLPAFVSFDQAFTEDSDLLAGTAVPNPAFGSPGPNTHDIALVLLKRPVNRGFAQLPSVGLLDPLAKSKSPLTIVGYGATGFLKGGGRPVPDFRLVRGFADARLLKLESAKKGLNLRMSGGICFGDSGGPVLLGDSDVVVGISSFVSNSRCAGNAFAFRMDTAEALGFLAPYL